MERKIRVGAVSYLNTKPLVWGFEQGMMANEVELSFNYPSKLATKLSAGDLDIALLPVASIPSIGEAKIISDFCIGASGPVASVCLFSDRPLKEIKRILLDYQSSSSVALLRLLLSKYWNLDISLEVGREGYEREIKEATAGLVIGDRAFELRDKYAFVYDLAEEWITFTGLPFVFAAWVSNRNLSEEFLTSFNKTTGAGLQNLDNIVKEQNFDGYNLYKYYTQNIDFHLDDAKKAGMKKFLQML